MYTEANKRAIAKYKKLKRKRVSCELDKQYYEQTLLPYANSLNLTTSNFVRKSIQYIIDHNIVLKGQDE